MSTLRARCMAAGRAGVALAGAGVTAGLTAGLAAGLTAGLTGCEERERWPAERQRQQPVPIERGLPEDCDHDTFCQAAPAELTTLAAPAPHERCASVVPLPVDSAAHMPEATRRTLRVVFDAEATSAAGTGCCYTWFEHCKGRLLSGPHAGGLLAPLVERDDWCDEPSSDAHGRRGDWLEAARYEHADRKSVV